MSDDQEKLEFVLLWCKKGNSPDETLYILKNRPDWMAGRLNLPGGKIEEGETPEQAARRELLEETGYDCATEPRVMGIMQDGGFKVHILRTVVIPDKEPTPRPEETETAHWILWREAVKDKRLLPNLRIIVPLCMTGVDGFVIGDTYRSGKGKRHTLKLSVIDQGETDGE